MKKMLLMLAILPACESFAQPACAPNNITTNPAAPVNAQVPVKRNTFFNWQNATWPVYTRYTAPGELIQSPFAQPNNSIINNFVWSQDMLADEGWELIHYGFGYNDNGTQQNPTIDNPWLVLYNKYQAVLRVFVARGGDVPFQGAKIELKFTNESPMQTSLLDLVKEPDALEQFFTKETMSSVSEFNNEKHKWFYADFAMQYDPCTCFFTSELIITVKLINTSTITLSGSATGTLTSIANNNGTVTQPNSSRSFKDILSGGKKAYEVYKSVDAFKNSYNESLNALKNQGKMTEAQRSDISGKKDLFAGLLKSSGFLRAGLKAAPYIGAAVSLLDFFIGGGKKDVPGPQEVKLTPMSLNMSIKLDGSITANSTYHNIIFGNPGSNNTSLPLFKYPYYNETMGVLNLLNRPKTRGFYYFDIIDDFGAMNMIERQRFILSEPIKFALNPASGLEIATINGEPDIQFCYVVEGTYTSTPYGVPTPSYGPGSFGWLEGTNGVTGTNQYRTEYYDIAYLNTTAPEIQSAENGIWFAPSKYYIKFLINLKRTSAAATSQNVLFVAKYPIVISNNYNFNDYTPGSSVFTGNPFVRANSSELFTFCNSAPYNRSYQNGGHFNRPGNSNPPVLQPAPTKATLSIMPNPVTDFMVANFTLPAKAITHIRITDAAGRGVAPLVNFGELAIGHYNKKIPLFGLTKGVYFVTLTVGQQTITKKIVKQ